MRFSASGFEPYESEIRRTASEMARDDIVARIWRKDASVWKDEDIEISDRLGWLEAPDRAEGLLPGVEAFVREVREAGCEQALLLGMGGSSLAPEVFSRVFGARKGFLTLDVLDSTDPEAVLGAAEKRDWERTIVLASSKSGTTLETVSLLNFFYARALEALGRERTGAHFAAITDPGTPLETAARELGFRRVFSGEEDIGGRFSVLSAFGLVPAALLGMDIPRLLAGARRAAGACRTAPPLENPGAALGLRLGILAGAGRDKPTFLITPKIESFGSWLEQLLAESTGKEGRGILPLIREARASFERGAPDRVAVHIGIGGDRSQDDELGRIKQSGMPLISFSLEDLNELGSQFFLWEMATAVAGYTLKVNPFDQPNVAASKKKTEALLKLREAPGGRSGADAGAAENELRPFLSRAQAGDYVAVQAFLPPAPGIRGRLEEFAAALRSGTGLPVVCDFGPRFLHSTGQLHKGDRGNGLFIQLTAGHSRDAQVPAGPGSSVTRYSFGTLIDAQASGDRQALREKSRRILHFHFPGGAEDGLRRLIESL